MRWRRRGTVALLSVLALGVAPASAHDVPVSRFSAPLPLPYLLAGAGLTVAVTAALLVAATDEAAEPTRSAFRPVPGSALAAGLRGLARLGFLALVAFAVWRGLVGPQVRAENVATVFVWPLWFTGVALVSVLLGSPWRVLSPWRTLYLGLSALEGERLRLLGSYPSRLGTWPAVAFFVVGLGVVENLTLVPRSPRATAALVAGYVALMLLGGVAFGDDWFRNADALDVLYRLFGRVAPVRVSRTDAGGYAVALRGPWRGCVEPVDDVATAAFVVAAVYTVSFDGFTNTRAFQTLLFAAREWTGLPLSSLGVALYAAGLVAFLLGFALVVAATRALAPRAGAGDLGAAMAAFAPTVLPIAAAYEVAHYYPFVVRNLGLLAGIAAGYVTGVSDPVALLGWLSLPVFWASQVVLVVAGHVAAVVAAHYVVLDRVPADRRGLAHAPTTALMVGYTVLSLWIISQPVVS